ncbi:MAG: hypothetical protein GTN69_07045 [Armatimonadetes bacterium]|nr:hypothetical protein [Armatimonadota bacterium]
MKACTFPTVHLIGLGYPACLVFRDDLWWLSTDSSGWGCLRDALIDNGVDPDSVSDEIKAMPNWSEP